MNKIVKTANIALLLAASAVATKKSSMPLMMRK